MTNKVIVKDSFIMPAVGETTELLLRECVDLVPYCWIWNKSVGYLEVTKYSGYDIYVTVKNPGLEENAVSGTVFPTCMEFLITAPNATPIIDNTVTCLRADFKCPAVGQEALMSVDSTSAIRVGDIIIVDTRYQYLVTEIINEHTMKVLNEEKGKESGVIDVKCNECVPVKILESTHCCEALQDQVDDIYNRIDTKKSVVSNNVLLSVDHGIDAISDVSYNIELDIDTDLSKYDNTVSKFTSLRYFKESTSGVNALFSPDRSTGLTNYNLGSSTSYYDNVYVDEVHGGQGKSSYIKFRPDGSDTEYYNGTSSAYNAHAFFSGGKKLVTFAHDESYFYTTITPNPSSTITLGNASKSWSNVYTDAITLNGTTYTSIPTVNDAKLTIYESDGVTPFVEFTANAASNVTATLPSSGSSLVYFEESYDSGTDTATFKPKNNTATHFNIGHFYNVFAQNYQYSDTTHSYISFPAADGGSIVINNGNSGTYGTDYNNIIFNLGTSGRLHINDQDITTYVDILPDTDNTYDLGNSGKAFTEGYISYLKTAQIENKYTGIDNIEFLNDSTVGHYVNYNAGTNSTNYGTHVFKSGGDAKLAVFNDSIKSYIDIVPNANDTFNLGNSNNTRFHQLWVQEIHMRIGIIPEISPNNVYIGTSGAKVGDIYCTRINGSNYNPSDRDKKENIVKRNNETKGKKTSLEIINSLDTYTYNYKDDEDKTIHIGIMAQDLQKESSECVVDRGNNNEKGEKESDLYIDTFGYITILTEAIKELSAEVKELKSKLGEKDANSEVLEK